MPRGAFALEPGEELRATAAASFRGAAAASVRASFALGSARVRRQAFEAWRETVEAIGFPTAGPEMVLACTNRRLVACRTTFWLGRAGAPAGDLALTDVVDVAVTRHGLVCSLAFALANGQVAEVEAMRPAPLRRLADAVRAELRTGR